MTLPRDFSWTAYGNWENKMEFAADTAPKCREFPDCNCEECHESHKEEGEFNEHCSECTAEKCPDCKGEIWLSNGDECLRCEGTGRIKQ